jgi:hypothetical protein
MRPKPRRGPGKAGEIPFTIQIFREDRWFVAHAPELDVSSAGENVKDAKVHLLEAVEAFLDEARRMGTLSEALREAGYRHLPTGWREPILLVTARAKVTTRP